jgi:hypothetical protein
MTVYKDEVSPDEIPPVQAGFHEKGLYPHRTISAKIVGEGVMMPGRKTLAIVLIATLLLAVTPVNAASNEPGMHIARMTIEPDGPDFNITVHYSTSFVTKIFSILFGAKAIQQGIVDQLSGFGDVELTSIDTIDESAKLKAKDQGRLSGVYYFYDNDTKFETAIDLLEIKGDSVDRTITIKNAESVPTFYYRSDIIDNMTNTTVAAKQS